MNGSPVWPRQPFIGLVLSAIAGIAVADCRPAFSNAAIAFVVIGGCAALIVRRSAATYAFTAAAFFLVHSARITDSAGLRLARALGDEVRAVSVRGVVVNEPKIAANGVATFLITVETLDLDASAVSEDARLLVRWKHPVEFGDEVNLFGTTEQIPPPRNPGEFDLREYERRQDVHRQLFVRYPENGSVIRHSTGNLIMRAAQRSRAWLHATLSRGLDDSPDVQALISGMVLGLRHQTPDDIEEPFQQTGTLHLFAVAGLHVGIVAQLLWILAAMARLPRKWATGLIIPTLLFYSAVTGFHTSSVRAALMSAVLLSGFFVERRVFALNSLAIAATAILCWDTNELFSVGYQLSFAVVGTILVVAEPTFRFLLRRFAQDPFLPPALFSAARRAGDRVWRWIARAASVSFAAWLGSLPLMFWDYHLITPISLLANLVVVPIAFFVLAGALVSVLCAAFSSALSLVFNNANWALSRVILSLVHLFSLLPGSHIYVERLHWPSVAKAELTALDVGTGAAIHVRTADRDWMIDAGGRRDFRRTVREYLRSRGVNRLDVLMLTHGDAAHVGGAEDILELFRPRLIFDTAARDRSRLHHHLSETIAAKHLAIDLLAAGDQVVLSRDVRARIIFPPKGFEADSADDQTLVLQLLLDGKPRVLLMSDSGDATERALLQSHIDLRSDIIVKGQNRSGVSCSAEFLDAVQPKLIVTTSRDFPESERIKEDWLEMANARQITVLRQDRVGAVTIELFRDHWAARGYVTGEIFRSSTR
ncbi:MAG: ComEC/Rec2 family competence protein [Verrucomicrobiota bacterium]|nr:ComEC/Rec2 family competence protein [Verrucomicrobiota bacterium]